MENQDKKQEQKPSDEFQKVLKGEPLGDILKEWARSDKNDYCNKCRSCP